MSLWSFLLGVVVGGAVAIPTFIVVANYVAWLDWNRPPKPPRRPPRAG